MSDNETLVIIFLFFAVMEFVLFKFMVIPFFINRRCRNWRVTQGVIIGSEYWSEVSGEGETLWYVRLDCRYTVGGREYTTDRYTLADCNQRVYPVDGKNPFENNDRINESIPVYYDPDCPSLAVLRNDFPNLTLFFIVNIVMIMYWAIMYNLKCL